MFGASGLQPTMCGKRLKAALALWLPYDEAEYGAHDPEAKMLLAQISPATLDRLLRTIRADAPPLAEG